MSAAPDAAAVRRPHRGSIFVEDAAILGVERFPGEQFVVRLAAADCAAHAVPGSFAHIRCDDALPMRRPLSIMRADRAGGWIDVLFKVVGEGLNFLAHRQPGERVSVMGPIGRGFVASAARPRPLLIGGGVGIPPMVFLAETLARDPGDWQPLVLMGSELPFPFAEQRAALPVAGIPGAVDRAMPLLESAAIPSRLASLSGFDGCYPGFVTDLADRWLAAQDGDVLAAVEVFACGPTPMLEAAARVAADYRLPCQVSLEEYMACAVGGCAGCTVLVHEPDGPAMRRVCVDGPVFDAAQVFPQSREAASRS